MRLRYQPGGSSPQTKGDAVFLRVFGLSILVTVLSLIAALIYGGWSALVLAATLGVLEVSLSFDNAVINATVLQRMNPFWQRMFLTVGVVIAVFGMRLVFPLLIVAIGAHLNPLQALDLALHPPTDGSPTYQSLLENANPKIAAYGGAFLLMLFLNFVFTERDITWLSWLERPLAKLGKLDMLSVATTLTILALTAGYVTPDDQAAVVMIAGSLGLVTYILVDALGARFGAEQDDDRPSDLTQTVGRAGLFLFLYLEVLDASFSFDGVIGAFAITADPIIIALGLGLIGAMFVRSITVFLVRKGTLAEYVYLEHGAHWAIGALAAILLFSTGHHIDEVATGLVGVAVIGMALLSSVLRNRRRSATMQPDPL